MSMNVQTGEGDEAELNTEINTTPLVDVMLVLLIIFLITVPVVLRQVKVELPHYRNIATQTKPENIVIAVDKTGRMYWNTVPVRSANELTRRFIDSLKKANATGAPYPEVHIRGDRDVRFEYIGRVIAAVQRAGVPKIGFITEPRHGEL